MTLAEQGSNGPALALADIRAEPSLIVIDAFLRAEALERPTVSHKAELAMAVRAVVLHSLFREWHRSSFLAAHPRVNFFCVL